MLRFLFIFSVLVAALLTIGIPSYAQEQKYTSLTIKEGLPSNFVYRALEDDRGFLWVATDAGLAKFDGKRFQVYTKKDGLPDNEVLSMVKEKNGRIWVNCFKQEPAYFDEILNRFVCPVPKHKLGNITSTLNMFLFALPNGGVMYANGKGNFVFVDKKLTAYRDFRPDFKFGLVKRNKDGSEFRTGTRITTTNKSISFGLYLTKENKIIDSVILSNKPQQRLGYAAIDNEKYYNCDSSFRKVNIYGDFKANPLRYTYDSLAVPEPFVNMLFTSTSLYLVANSGKIYVYDKLTLKLTDVVNGDYLPNSYYDDSRGNKWISTIDKGLVLYKKTPLKIVKTPLNYVGTNFISLARTTSGTLLSGNYYGEVLETKNGNSTVHKVTNMVASRIRKIILSGSDVFTFSEQGTFHNYKNPIINPNSNRLHRSKTAVALNDSMIIVGTHSGLDVLNTKTRKIRNLNPKDLRITALAKKDEQTVYFGSLNGLYQYDVEKNTYVSLIPISELLRDKITALCYTKDKLLWVSTSGIGIMAIKDGKIVPGSSIQNGQYRNIISTKKGQLWVATPNGIQIINYQLKANRINFSVSNLTKNDGLASNDVQEMIHQEGFVYAATTNGISVIPDTFVVPNVDIPTYLIRLSVNQKDTILAKRYTLDYNENSIQMQFAGVDLDGHLKHLQYTINKNANWINLDQNTLNVQLTSGEHSLQVRAVDVSGNVSAEVLTLTFEIATPFWKRIWFWLLIAVVFQILIIYFLSKQQKRRREVRLAKKIAAVQTAELEQQAFTSLMNPHFIFNALNSIQHYINVQDRQNANRYLSDFASLIRRNFEGAQLSFIPLEEEIENIKLYLNLEQMRFNDQFEYKIIIDRKLEVEEWMIPTMILQPLLENALLHGIMPSSIAGKVTIKFNLQDEDLLITLTDNGIGLVNSEVLKKNSTHKSSGMGLIRKRIKALNSFSNDPISMTMEPAHKSKKNPGNIVSFLIPVTLHQAWLGARCS